MTDDEKQEDAFYMAISKIINFTFKTLQEENINVISINDFINFVASLAISTIANFSAQLLGGSIEEFKNMLLLTGYGISESVNDGQRMYNFEKKIKKIASEIAATKKGVH